MLLSMGGFLASVGVKFVPLRLLVFTQPEWKMNEMIEVGLLLCKVYGAHASSNVVEFNEVPFSKSKWPCPLIYEIPGLLLQ